MLARAFPITDHVLQFPDNAPIATSEWVLPGSTGAPRGAESA
jgi:hypothetical protein